MPGKGTDKLAPEIHLRVDGADAHETRVEEVSVLQDVSAPGMFTLRMSYWDLNRNVVWEKENLFAEGREVEIQMGYAGAPLATMMVGEITGLEPELSAGEVPMLTVRGYDCRHRLMLGRKTRSFTQVKDSAIATRVAEDAGLSAVVEDTRVTHEYVLQHNQTDWEFLEGRARRLGFEVVAERKTLKFQPHKNDRSEVEVIPLSFDDLIEFRPRLSTRGVAGEVIVQGWSPKDKQEITGKASAGDIGTTMGSRGGPAVVKAAFKIKACQDSVVDRPVFSQAEAEQIARGRLKEMALAYVTGEGVTKGCTDLKAGTVVRIAGIGKRFSGLYYLTSVCHTYSPRRGYRSAFTVGRNAT